MWICCTLQIHIITIIIIIGALHTGTETGFTESGSPMRIQCDSRMSSTRHTRLCTLHCWTQCHAAQHAAWIRIGGREATKWSLDPDPRSASDPNPSSRVESPIIIIIIIIILSLLSVCRDPHLAKFNQFYPLHSICHEACEPGWLTLH